MKITHVVGARPNFMKLAPCERALATHGGVAQRIVHTGQHYDDAMSDAFFRELGIPEPDVNLEVGSASHAAQTGRIMERLEPVVLDERPDWVVVYGDVNSTAAAALVCAKLGVRLAHVEAGLRSFDRTMPEEINRLVTDRLADLLLTPSRDADENLRREGIEPEKIVFVGNVMVDSLMYTLDRALSQNPAALFGASDIDYAIVTLHRPSNVDAPDRLHRICRALGELAKELRVIFPMHPRTRARLSAADHKALGSVHMIDPLAYHEMIALTSRARVAITDSGGVQEETTVLGIPCLTLRENTERPITVTEGTNQLVREPEDLLELALLRRANGQRRTPEGWDGRAGERVAAALISLP